jgi:hypothetical protein
MEKEIDQRSGIPKSLDCQQLNDDAVGSNIILWCLLHQYRQSYKHKLQECDYLCNVNHFIREVQNMQ